MVGQGGSSRSGRASAELHPGYDEEGGSPGQPVLRAAAAATRQDRPVPPRPDRSPEGPTVVTVGTLNVRNTADRWRERAPLLVRQLVELMPHVIGLQELRRLPSQTRRIAREAEARSGAPPPLFAPYCTGKTGWWQLWEGLAVLSRLPVVERGSISLRGQHRVAQRVVVRLPDGGLLGFCNAHLSSAPDEAQRTRQAQLLLDWMDERPALPQVLVGDFNARPTTPTVGLVKERLASAYEAVHGQEPPKTVPTPLRVGATGKGAVLDYVFVSSLVEVHGARVTFDEVGADDPHLAASDHYGLAATVSVIPSD